MLNNDSMHAFSDNIVIMLWFRRKVLWKVFIDVVTCEN